ncbi:MAG: hypothetical protein QOD98_3133 [Nocardioidaceae bacterium]|nr:hypothetical protein [Nocardioidaceae bacterium]
MSLPVVIYVLTALSAVVVVLTRLRMRGGQGAGRFHVGNRLLDVHTITGVLALVVWTAFLVAPESSPVGSSTFGIIGLGLFWIVAIVGLMILVRWLPSHGKHASDAVQDSWSEGPGLSVLAHVGMLVGVILFTFAYLTNAV